GAQGRMDRGRAASGRRRGTLQRVPRRDVRALFDARPRAGRRHRAPPRQPRAAHPRQRPLDRGPRAPFRRGAHRGRGRLPGRGGVGRDRRGRAVAPHQVRAAHGRGRALGGEGVPRAMRPLAELPRATLASVRAVLTDIDDTLTTDGKLHALALAALERLHAAGLLVVPVTGRPAGWCDHIARMWPVDAVVGENGAFYMHFEAARRKLVRRFAEGDADRAAQRARIAAIGAAIVNGVPGSALASDQQYRETDLAIDYCEDVPPLPREAVDRIVALMQAQGMTAKVSSIHVNGWFGSYDKLAMTRTL